jgi:hypothetical protein
MTQIYNRIFKAFGRRSTHWIALNFGKVFPFYYVCEYPKSGGTWLSQMLSDYLVIPFPRNYIFPIGFKSVIHNHWPYSPRFDRVLYLYRDGRDIAISNLFHIRRQLMHINNSIYRNTLLKEYEYLSKKELSKDDIRKYLPNFIKKWYQLPIGTKLNWGCHIEQWAFNRDNVVTLSYEQLKTNCESTLKNTLIKLDIKVDTKRLAETVDKFSFERQTGRKPGQESAKSFLRKGIMGDWKNYFTQKAGRVFNRFFGDYLIRLGYEKNKHWYKNCGR